MEALKDEHIENVVQVVPHLANVPRDCWLKCHSTFLNYGLGTTNFLRIVTGNPKVLLWPSNRILSALECWRCCQFSEYNMFLLITKYPTLIETNNADQILKPVNLLLQHVGTRKNVWKLLMNNPEVLKQPLNQIDEKFIYLKEELCLEIPEIVKSLALSMPLFEIQCRVIFAQRLSLFNPVSSKANSNAPTRNFRLYKITDTSNKTFATKVCHVSLEEFEVFQQLYKRELKQNERLQQGKHTFLQDDDDDDDDYFHQYTEDI